jgi:hypothetical protein
MMEREIPEGGLAVCGKAPSRSSRAVRCSPQIVGRTSRGSVLAGEKLAVPEAGL